jgi:hypothetical protein
LVEVSDFQWFWELSSREVMLSYESPVDAGDVCTTIDESVTVDGFYG